MLLEGQTSGVAEPWCGNAPGGGMPLGYCATCRPFGPWYACARIMVEVDVNLDPSCIIIITDLQHVTRGIMFWNINLVKDGTTVCQKRFLSFSSFFFSEQKKNGRRSGQLQ